jgi:hypothetical protein
MIGLKLEQLNQLMNLSTYKALVPAYKILVFYFVVMFVTSTVGYTLDNKDGFSYGLVLGVVVSLGLWFQYGRKMAYV